MPKGVKYGGRQKGSVNKVTAEIGNLAREYGPDSVDKLWEIARKSKSDPAKVAAIRELLDRGYGKPAQSMTLKGDPANPLMIVSKDQKDAAVKAATRAGS